MRRWLLRLALAAVIVFLGLWSWRHFFPRPEQVIRENIAALARAGSYSGHGGAASEFLAARNVGSFFTLDTEVNVNMHFAGQEESVLTGRDELMKTVLAARSAFAGVQVDFPDVVVTVAPDKQSAEVSATARVRVTGEQGNYPQELKFIFTKIDGEWLIRRVDTVRTLQ